MESNHVDVDHLLEDYAWNQFKDLMTNRRTILTEFKSLEREDVEFTINRKNLIVTNEDPLYENFQPAGAKRYTLFKSIFRNCTTRSQEYSFKTERTTESVCTVEREQGWMLGTDAELTLKTPCEIAELKAAFKHEIHFNKVNENAHTKSLTWGVDSTVNVPANYLTEASVVVEEMNYKGSYKVVTRLQGSVVISIQRRRDSQLVLPVRVDIAELFRIYLESPHARKDIKAVSSVEQKVVRLVSKGSCHFQFAMKQQIELREELLNEKEKMMIDY